MEPRPRHLIGVTWPHRRRGHASWRAGALPSPVTRRADAAAIPLKGAGSTPYDRHTAPVKSADVFDDLDELVHAVALAPGEVDELTSPLDNDSTFGRPGDRDATPASELE